MDRARFQMLSGLRWISSISASHEEIRALDTAEGLSSYTPKTWFGTRKEALLAGFIEIHQTAPPPHLLANSQSSLLIHTEISRGDVLTPNPRTQLHSFPWNFLSCVCFTFTFLFSLLKFVFCSFVMLFLLILFLCLFKWTHTRTHTPDLLKITFKQHQNRSSGSVTFSPQPAPIQ